MDLRIGLRHHSVQSPLWQPRYLDPNRFTVRLLPTLVVSIGILVLVAVGSVLVVNWAADRFIVREFINARWPNLLKKKPARTKSAPADWRPTEAVARALLDEADKLAAAGRYAEAARLLLHRSIEEIEGRRPRLVRPALTSREISGLPDIPEAARTTFAAIAAVVERSFFGGRDVDAAGFAECRRTYEAFAFPGAWA